MREVQDKLAALEKELQVAEKEKEGWISVIYRYRIFVFILNWVLKSWALVYMERSVPKWIKSISPFNWVSDEFLQTKYYIESVSRKWRYSRMIHNKKKQWSPYLQISLDNVTYVWLSTLILNTSYILLVLNTWLTYDSQHYFLYEIV